MYQNFKIILVVHSLSPNSPTLK